MKLLIIYVLASLSCCLSARLDNEWWKQTEIYDILIWSFKDTDGDGIGDLNGVTSKLDYLKELGIDTIKLSPIFSSIENIHQNYTINDFQKIHTTLGNMNDFDNLVKEAKARGIKVILDFVINHCSTYHEWFKKSQQRIAPYTDYFIWRDKIPGRSMRYYFYGYDPNWEWDKIRKQFYYHNYESSSIDLNLRNEAVKEEIKKLMKFWFDKGVSGLHLLSANVYMEYFPENSGDDDDYDEDGTAVREDLPESYEFIHELREYVDLYNEKNGGHERVLIVAQSNIEKYPNLRGNSTYPIAHIVSQSILENHDTTVKYYESYYLNWVIAHTETEKENGPLLLISEDVGTFRLANRFYTEQLIDVWLTAVFMLPLIVHIYYGQEIHLADCWSNQYDLFYQRPFPASMQWDNSLLAGFSDSEFTLMPPNTNYWKNNVEKSKTTEFSSYNMMKDLLKLRKTETLKHGQVKSYIISRWILAFTRFYEGKETYITILNLENQSNILKLREIFKDLPKTVRVVASSPNAVHRKGNVIETASSLPINPTSSMVILVENMNL